MSDLGQLVQFILPQTKFEKVTDGIAVAGTASPFWLPVLKQWSDIATYALPLAGITWLIVQIVSKILLTRKALRNGK